MTMHSARLIKAAILFLVLMLLLHAREANGFPTSRRAYRPPLHFVLIASHDVSHRQGQPQSAAGIHERWCEE